MSVCLYVCLFVSNGFVMRIGFYPVFHSGADRPLTWVRANWYHRPINTRRLNTSFPDIPCGRGTVRPVPGMANPAKRARHSFSAWPREKSSLSPQEPHSVRIASVDQRSVFSFFDIKFCGWCCAKTVAVLAVLVTKTEDEVRQRNATRKCQKSRTASVSRKVHQLFFTRSLPSKCLCYANFSRNQARKEFQTNGESRMVMVM